MLRILYRLRVRWATVLIPLFLSLGWAQGATVTWVGKGDGRTWAVAANWDLNRLPAEADDVVIPAGFTGVEHASGRTFIRRLTAAGGLRLRGGSLILTEGESRAGGDFLVLAGATLEVTGVRTGFQLEGNPVEWSGNLQAGEGAQVRLTSLTGIVGRNPNWRADGPGTLIEARAVSQIGLTTDGWFPVEASDEARIDLGGLTTVRGPLRPTAEAGGVIDLSGLRGRWTSTGFSYSPIVTARDGGRILMAGITEIDGGEVEIDDAEALSTRQWTAFTDSVLRLESATLLLGGLENLDDSHLHVRDGAVLRLPALRTLRGRNPDWSVVGAGSLIEASAVTNVVLTRDGWFPLNAEGFGRIDLSGLPLLRGPLRPAAEDGGVIDLGGAKGRWTSEGFTYRHIVTVADEGQVLLRGITEFEQGELDLDAAEGVPTEQWTVFTESDLRLRGGVLRWGILTQMDGSHLRLIDGAVLQLPALREVRGVNPDWNVFGFGTRIEAGAVTNVALTTGGWFPLAAASEGRIDLSGLASLRGPLRPTAESGGVVDLSRAKGSWSSLGYTYPHIVTAYTRGEVILGGITVFDRGEVDLDGSGEVGFGQWTSFTRSTLRLQKGTLNALALENVDESDLRLLDGAVLRLPQVRQVRGQSLAWRASGAGTLLEARSVSDIALTTDGYFQIEAENLGRIDLSGLATAAGPLQIEADTGGVVDLGGVRGFWSVAGFLYSPKLIARQGGQVLVGGVTGLEEAQLRIEAGGVIPTAQMTRVVNSSVVVDGAGSLANFGSLQDQTGSTLVAQNGGRIAFGAAPRIVATPPVASSVVLGGTLELAVVAEGEAPLRYQWRRNGQPLAGQTAAILRIEGMRLEDGGAYTVVVSNGAGSAESAPSQITPDVRDLPFADLAARRGLITQASGLGVADNLDAGVEPGEVRHAGKPGGASVWITWRAPDSGVVRMRTVGSTFDTLLAVYRRGAVGDPPGTGVLVASDDDGGGDLTSSLRFNAVAGAEYDVAVDGYAGAGGVVVFSWDLVQTLMALPEILEAPQSVLAVPGQEVVFRVTASPEAVTYQWLFNERELPGQTGAALRIGAVTGADAGAYQVRVGTSPSTELVSASARLEVIEGTRSAAVFSADKLADLFGEDENAGLAGPRDPRRGATEAERRELAGGVDLAAPVTVGLPGSQWTDNTGSSRGVDDPTACEVLTTATRWFRLRFPVTGSKPVKLTTLGSEIATLLAVFTNRQDLTLIACDVAAPPTQVSAAVEIVPQRNVDYLVLVDGVNGAQGPIKLNWSAEEEPRPEVGIVGGRFQVKMRVAPGPYDWERGAALGTWQGLFRTNLANGVFEYADPDPATASARYFRLVPVDSGGAPGANP